MTVDIQCRISRGLLHRPQFHPEVYCAERHRGAGAMLMKEFETAKVKRRISQQQFASLGWNKPVEQQHETLQKFIRLAGYTEHDQA